MDSGSTPGPVSVSRIRISSKSAMEECEAGSVFVMCSLERFHDSDPTPPIVSSVPTPAKREPLVPPGVAVVWSRPQLSGVVQSRAESTGIGVGRSQPEPSSAMCL